MFNVIFDNSNPVFWVFWAFVLFVGLSANKICKLLANVLDARSNKIKAELDAAKELRIEAENVLALYKQRQAEFAKEAESILAKARKDSETNTQIAQAELKIALDNRTKQALEKIAMEESAAITDVRNRVIDIATSSSRNIISEIMDNAVQADLVKNAVHDIEQKIH